MIFQSQEPAPFAVFAVLCRCCRFCCARLQDGPNSSLLSVSSSLQVPEIWKEACTKGDGDAWWEAMAPVSVDLSNNQIRDLPEGLCQLAETLETLVLT